MGIRDVQDAWNGEAPNYPVSQAFLRYEFDNATGVQWQVIEFHGTSPAGDAFTFTTDRHSIASDTVEVAREAARWLLNSQSAKGST